MKRIAFFGSRAGVGTTTVCFHLAHMLSRMGLRVVAADLDPQAGLTAYCLPVEEIEQLWTEATRPVHLANCVTPPPHPRAQMPELTTITDALHLLPGNPDVRGVEAVVGSYETASAVAEVLAKLEMGYQADVAVLDGGWALSGAAKGALFASDYDVVTMAPDIFSVQGVRTLGAALEEWRLQARESWPWIRRSQPTGYVTVQHSVRKARGGQADGVWVGRIPESYHRHVRRDRQLAASTPERDPDFIGHIRAYQSLTPLSRYANKPMFDLTAADGIARGQDGYVAACRDNFEAVALALAERCGLVPRPAAEE